MLEKKNQKSWNLIHSLPCRTSCKIFIHKVLFGPLGLHLHVWSELGRSPPFRPMRALRLMVAGLQSCVWIGPYMIVASVPGDFEHKWSKSYSFQVRLVTYYDILRFLLLIRGIFHIHSSKRIDGFLEVLSFNWLFFKSTDSSIITLIIPISEGRLTMSMRN